MSLVDTEAVYFFHLEILVVIIIVLKIIFSITHYNCDSQTHTTKVIKHEIVFGKQGAIYKTGQETKLSL